MTSGSICIQSAKSACKYLLVFGKELDVEGFEVGQHLLQFLHLRQNGDAEVVRSRLFSKPATRNGADTRFLQECKAVEGIWCLSSSFGCLDDFGWQVKAWESIHGSLNLIAGDSLYGVEKAGYKLCLKTQP